MTYDLDPISTRGFKKDTLEESKSKIKVSVMSFYFVLEVRCTDTQVTWGKEEVQPFFKNKNFF